MIRAIWMVTCVAAAAVGCAQPTPEEQFLTDVTTALGGRERVMAVRSIVLEGEGTQYNLGQDLTPDATGQTFTLSDYARRIDVAGGRLRIEQVRTPNFAYFQGQDPQKQQVGLDGDIAYSVGPSGTATRGSAAAAGDRRADLMHHPITLVRAALDPSTKLGAIQTSDGERRADVTLSNGATFVLVVDATTGRPTRIESRSAHPNLGDVTIATSFADYEEVGGLQLPTRITTRADEFTTSELRIEQQRVDEEVGNLAAPAPAASAAVAVAPPPSVSVEPVGKGIWLLAGQSHHSVLVELANHLMLIEAPQSEARTQAVIAKARETVPGKPLTQLVTTHHHFDHTAGVRAAVAEGLTIVTHSGNRAFFERMTARPHTVAPDALARQPRPVTIETVDEELVIEDPTTPVTLFHVAGNPHSETMLAAYFPRERVLVEVDAFSPGSAVHPYAANLLEHVAKRKLRVDRIVPLHGPVVPFAELEKVVVPKTD